jgi:hypothetical protein
MDCWICKKPANSSEHKVKKADIKRLWGNGPYKGENALVRIKNSELLDIPGPNSGIVKFNKNLCAYCNSTFTQPFDNAYDEFINWFESNKNFIYSKRVIDWQMVYGNDYPSKQNNLFKYFAKCLGCRLSDHGDIVPKDIIDLLSKKKFETFLKVSFAINEDVALLPEKDMGIGIHTLQREQFDGYSSISYLAGNNYKWLDMFFYYMYPYDNSLGSPWIANSRYVYVGFRAPLSESMRKEIKKKIQNRKFSSSESK